MPIIIDVYAIYLGCKTQKDEIYAMREVKNEKQSVCFLSDKTYLEVSCSLLSSSSYPCLFFFPRPTHLFLSFFLQLLGC